MLPWPKTMKNGWNETASFIYPSYREYSVQRREISQVVSWGTQMAKMPLYARLQSISILYIQIKWRVGTQVEATTSVKRGARVYSMTDTLCTNAWSKQNRGWWVVTLPLPSNDNNNNNKILTNRSNFTGKEKASLSANTPACGAVTDLEALAERMALPRQCGTAHVLGGWKGKKMDDSSVCQTFCPKRKNGI